MAQITSLTNQLIKDTVKLHQKKYRAQSGLFLLEGYKPIFEAVQSGIEIQTVFTTEKNISEFGFVNINSKDKIITVTEPVLEKISTTDSMPEAVAVGVIPNYEINKNSKRIALLENIKDAGNLGTIIRSAAAFNIEGIILSGDTIDPFSPKVVRSAVGALFKVPVVKIADIEDVKKEFNGHNFIATVVNHADIINPEKIDLKKPFIIMLGSEADGLSEKAVALSNIKTTIPMTSKTESLNLSAAASIMFYIL